MSTNQTIDGVPREFVREGRYIVVRPDHEDDLRTERLRNYIEEMCFHTPDCVVVEADWPEYEKVWGMIEARVTGRQTELDSALATIAHLRDDLEGTRLLAADQLLKIKQQRAEIYRLKSGKGEPAACAVKLSPARGERINAVEKPVNRRVCHACIGLNREVFCHICDDCAEQPAPVAVVMPERVVLRDIIAQAIGGDAYDCIRVWSAWGVGTMSDDDFIPIVDQEERLYEIADACLDEVTRLNTK